MAASPSDVARSIEPGSTESGERGPLAADIQSNLQGLAGAGPSLGPEATSPDIGGIDPIQKLLDGETSDLPVTDGMDVGPGAGPGTGLDAVKQSPRVQKLRMIALGAKSPVLRQFARNALRAEIRRAG